MTVEGTPLKIALLLLPAICLASTPHRLNRAEYNYAVRDLLGVLAQPADDFPQDDSGYGFDNIGDVLSVSPLLMERYLHAAETVARLAMFGLPPAQPTLVKFQAPRRDPLNADAADATGLSLHSAMHKLYRFPATGEYAFSPGIDGGAAQAPGTVRVGIWIDGQLAATQEVSAAAAGRQRLETRAKVSGGEHVLSVTFLDPFIGRVAVLDLGGPFDGTAGPSPESLKLIYSCGHLDGRHTPACDRIIVTNLARRAYRRPPSAAEIEKLTGLMALAKQQGASYDEAVSAAIEAVLVSPNFVFRVEKPQPGAYELASRLSFWLWSSIPDDELLRAAGNGSLRKPAVLEAQVHRMLADAKSARFVENFGGQWLETRRLESVKPDVRKFPDFDDYLRYSMRRETELFFENVIHEDRGILDFIDGRTTFVNQRLAALYGIPNVSGTEFRKVDLTGIPRAGVLTQASVLTVSSYANRTSPVLRGKWILENFLNAAPPPPPPDVPNLDESAAGTSGSMRRQMEQHRANPACAGCHSMMDPIGFSLENYDGIGKWRDKDGSFPIDASGTLPGGREFSGAAGLQEVLRGKAQDFTRCLTQKMMTYALGRGLEQSDNAALDDIVKRVAAHRYKFSSLVVEIARRMETQQ
ncbi:MAG TPA: DUF1592 domain-containing protein [Candidatus Limnocylindrales bacterium]|nr:DUF1592 domain-containing protein [Candidatus Limnocylindrales bacterium]